MTRIITTEIWLSRIPVEHFKIHDYSRAVYLSAKGLVEIGCKLHGFFWQVAEVHARGSGCPECGQLRRGSSQRTPQDDFIKKSQAANGEQYDHSKVVYKNSTTCVELICPIDGHGAFSMLPLNRLRGQQCPKCALSTRAMKSRKTQEQFLKECEELGKDHLTFTKAKYVADKVKVTVTCKNHSDFDIWPSNLLQGQGCPSCASYGYDIGKAGYLYILSDNRLTKVGITNRAPSKRISEIYRSGGPQLEVIVSFYFKDGSAARNLELSSHAYLESLYQRTPEAFDGSTECFLNVDIPALLAFVTPLASN